jgi:hypothetical protein
MQMEEFIGTTLRDYQGARLDKHKLTSILTRFEKEVCGIEAEPSVVREYNEAKQKISDLELKMMGVMQSIARAKELLTPDATEASAKEAWEILDSLVPSATQG